MSLISDDDEHSLGAFAAATNMNQLASVQETALEHRITHGFPKRQFDELLRSANAKGSSDQTHEPVHQRCDQADLASAAERITTGAESRNSARWCSPMPKTSRPTLSAGSISSSRWCMRSTGLSVNPVAGSEIAAAKLSIPICITVISPGQLSFRLTGALRRYLIVGLKTLD